MQDIEEVETPTEFIKRWERNFTYVGFDCIRQRKRENLTEFRARVRILLDARKVKTEKKYQLDSVSYPELLNVIAMLSNSGKI